MRQWLGGALPGAADWPNGDAAWQAVQNRASGYFLGAFRAVRAEQIALLDQLGAVDWTAPRQTGWAEKSLAMVVTKTFRHPGLARAARPDRSWGKRGTQ